MKKETNKMNDLFRSAIIWFLVFLAIMWGYKKFFAPKEVNLNPKAIDISISLQDDDLSLGNLAIFKIKNNGLQEAILKSPCENTENPTLKVYKLVNGRRFELENFANCGDKKVAGVKVPAQSTVSFSVPEFSADIFNEAGQYFAEFNFEQNGDPVMVETPIFSYEKPGIFVTFFRSLITKPLFNLLVFFTQHLPNKSLGWGIIILTLLVRALLFIPNQKAMKSQRNMQKLQPKLEEIKQKYAGDQQKIAMKTMELYKTHKISPVGSCLPMLLQLPVMLGVYYIVRDGMSPHLNYLLYSFQQGINITDVNTFFAGLDLLKKNVYVLPIIVGVAQWVAIRLSLVSAKKRSSGKPAKKEGMTGQMQQMNVVMQWGMPAMIAFFTMTFPAAVGIYWLTSTLFGIAQQKYVNWKLDQPQVVKKGS